MTDDPTGKLSSLQRENEALRARVGELERRLARHDTGPPRSGPSLAEREALLGEVERAAHIGTWTWNLETDEVDWSDELFRILGYEPDRDLPSTEAFFAAVHPEDRAHVQTVSASGIARGISEQVEYRVLRRDGSVRWVTMSGALLFDAGGAPKRAVGSVLDLTAAKAAAEALRRVNAHLEDAQRIANIGSWVWEPEHDRAEWSPQMYRILGLDPTVAPRLELAFEMVVEADHARMEGWIAALMRGESPGELEVRVRRPDGEERHLLLLSFSELREDGTPQAIRGTLLDITHRVRLEQQVREAHKMEAVGRLAGGVAHDFNNLLTIIISGVEALRRGGDPQALELIALAAQSAAELTRRLLAFGRRAVVAPERLRLAEVVSSLRPLLESSVGEDVEVRFAIADEGACVHIDRTQMQQILVNLVVNARDAMPGGGHLDVSVRRVELGEGRPAALRQLAPGAFVLLSVRDDGVGMGDEVAARIFEPFFSTKEPGRGTGLGLSIVYGAVRQAGGHVTVSSAPGRGATFDVYLPESAPADAGSGSAVRAPASPARSRILLVEDNDAIRGLLRAQLERAGHEVGSAPNAERALELAEREAPFDLLVTDIVMPGLRGTELAARLRERGDLRVLFVTGYASELALGRGDRVLQKPFRQAELLEAVASLLAVPAVRARGPGTP